MDDARGQRQAFDRRLRDLEREFERGGRVSALETQFENLAPRVDEVLLATRVAAGVKKALADDDTVGLNRWQKFGIATAAATGAGGFILSIVVAVHGG